MSAFFSVAPVREEPNGRLSEPKLRILEAASPAELELNVEHFRARAGVRLCAVSAAHVIVEPASEYEGGGTRVTWHLTAIYQERKGAPE